MMKPATFKYILNSNKDLILHPVLGIILGFFLLHPIAMSIFWFEGNDYLLNLENFKYLFNFLVFESFSPEMSQMSAAFAIIGLLGGLGSGFYSRTLKRREHRLFGNRQLLNKSIPSLIASGQNDYVEFKSSLRYDYRQIKTDKNLETVILKEIAGFLNGKGGILIIGVDDEGKTLGLENDYWTLKRKNKDGFQQRVITLISNAFGKDICSNVHITFQNLESREICLIHINSAHNPIYLQEGNRTIFYLRTGNITNPLTTKETVQYLQTRQLA